MTQAVLNRSTDGSPGKIHSFTTSSHIEHEREREKSVTGCGWVFAYLGSVDRDRWTVLNSSFEEIDEDPKTNRKTICDDCRAVTIHGGFGK